MQRVWKLGVIFACSRYLSLGCLVLASVTMWGCQTYPPPQRPYKPNPPEGKALQTDLRIAVVEFEDTSRIGEQSGAGGWTVFLMMLPGVPYAEMGGNNQEPYPVGKCLADELKSSGQYKTVDYYPDWSEIAQRRGEYDFLVTGAALYDKKHWYLTYYALGIPGVYVVMTGTPNVWVERHASFEVQAILPQNPHKPIWSEKISFEDPSKVWASSLGASVLENRDVFSPCPTEVVAPQLLRVRNKLYDVATSSKLAQPITSKQ